MICPKKRQLELPHLSRGVIDGRFHSGFKDPVTGQSCTHRGETTWSARNGKYHAPCCVIIVAFYDDLVGMLTAKLFDKIDLATKSYLVLQTVKLIIFLFSCLRSVIGPFW